MRTFVFLMSFLGFGFVGFDQTNENKMEDQNSETVISIQKGGGGIWPEDDKENDSSNGG